ncbi:uncharacterized protein LOC121377901 [Gigantopelta aegis]|uniref:uncharacterized protein LOC121377901 n=1 Tax=Gigantopelta aegis TaxID=1735272 RepID=UPI001B88E2BD|nr:uncharacterized protein LOC121377901 [Gigantopelta aegis]
MKTANEDIFHLSKNMNEVQEENQRLYDEILYLQTRSMRFNSLFSGIPDQGQDENTEDVLKSFIKKELEIEDDLPIQVTHRLGPYRPSNQRPRTIVAHFRQLKEKDKIKQAAKKPAGKPFGINYQFPREIAERRNELYPIFREAKKKNQKAFLKVDRLFINGKEYLPESRLYNPHQYQTPMRHQALETDISGRAPSKKRPNPSPGFEDTNRFDALASLPPN